MNPRKWKVLAVTAVVIVSFVAATAEGDNTYRAPRVTQQPVATADPVQQQREIEATERKAFIGLLCADADLRSGTTTCYDNTPMWGWDIEVLRQSVAAMR